MIPPGITLGVRTETALWELLWERYGNERSARTLIVEFSGGNGAPERIRTADPQIRSLGLRLGRTFLYRFFGLVEARRDLTDFLNQRDRDYCIGMISSRW